jgi:hypothetical protein
MKIKQGQEATYAEYVATNSKDFYSSGVVTFSERWADLMEAELSNGIAIEKMAKRTSHKADTDGISVFMYGCAVASLAKFWEHGEALRRWHNGDCQIGTEGDEANESGGILNPAVMVIADKTK